jgi:hypothetical protein
MSASWLATAALAVGLSTVPLSALTEATIKYRKSVSLHVGQSVVVHGIRGECGQEPVLSEIKLPGLATGELRLGKMGVRQSGRCDGLTPAVEMIFTATSAGRETFEVEGDKISVRVKD